MTDQHTLSGSLAVWEAQLPRPVQHAGGWIYGPFLPTAMISLLLLSLLAGALIYLASLAASMRHAYIRGCSVL